MAVFIPILMMGGIVGRLFREFAVTLSVAILVSLLVSLTTTPMMCSRLLKHETAGRHGRIYQVSEKVLTGCSDLRAQPALGAGTRAFTLAVLLITIAVNVYLLVIVPKGFFPLQDNGTLRGGISGDQDISFQAMDHVTRALRTSSRRDPAVAT